MTKEETTATWQCWLLDAIHKIRYQKQRPNVQRVAACIRMHHPQYSDEAVEEHLEQCVKNGSRAKVETKGLTSYRDPGSGAVAGYCWRVKLSPSNTAQKIATIGIVYVTADAKSGDAILTKTLKRV